MHPSVWWCRGSLGDCTQLLWPGPPGSAPRQCSRHITQFLSWTRHPNFHRHHPNPLLEMQSFFWGYKIKFKHSGYEHIPNMPSWGYSRVILVELKVFPEILQTTLKKCLLVYIFSIDSVLFSFHSQMITDSFNKYLIVPRTLCSRSWSSEHARSLKPGGAHYVSPHF